MRFPKEMPQQGAITAALLAAIMPRSGEHRWTAWARAWRKPFDYSTFERFDHR